MLIVRKRINSKGLKIFEDIEKNLNSVIFNTF